MPVASLPPSRMRIDMAAGDMAELVGDHALQLVGIVGRLDQPGIDVDDLPAGDEGVDLRSSISIDLDVVRIEPARP